MKIREPRFLILGLVSFIIGAFVMYIIETFLTSMKLAQNLEVKIVADYM